MLRQQFEEQTIIFFSILKWVALATAAGLIVGVACYLFIEALDWSTGHSQNQSLYFLALPLVFVFNTWAINRFAPDAKGHGTEKVIEAIHKAAGKIKFKVVPVKLVTTIVTLAFGGSAGKEGPCAQIGAGLTSLGSDLLRLSDEDRKKLVICGISAGFAAVFGTPISGAIFGVEVLFVGSVLYEVMLPSFISGVVAYQVASALGMHYFHSPIVFDPVFSESFFLKVMLAGVFFGLVSSVLVESLRFSEKKVHQWKLAPWKKNLIGGGALVILTLLLSNQFLGLGLDTIEQAIQGAPILWYAFLLKILFTVITLSFGGSGGIVTPIFFIGSTAGCALAMAAGLDQSTFAAFGMVALLAGSANTPISASIMGMELFGPEMGPYAAVACVISYLMTGHRSVYPSQILTTRKSELVEVSLGGVMDKAEPFISDKRRYRIYQVPRWLRKWYIQHQPMPHPGEEGTDHPHGEKHPLSHVPEMPAARSEESSVDPKIDGSAPPALPDPKE